MKEQVRATRTLEAPVREALISATPGTRPRTTIGVPLLAAIKPVCTPAIAHQHQDAAVRPALCRIIAH